MNTVNHLIRSSISSSISPGLLSIVTKYSKVKLVLEHAILSAESVMKKMRKSCLVRLPQTIFTSSSQSTPALHLVSLSNISKEKPLVSFKWNFPNSKNVTGDNISGLEAILSSALAMFPQQWSRNILNTISRPRKVKILSALKNSRFPIYPKSVYLQCTVI